jgi:murein DD-endopeptidase MepM/ murein hydrolase activator NlpD
VIAALVSPSAAAACATIQHDARDPFLFTRKPLIGEDVRLVSGFGMRNHPLLMSRKMHTGIDWAATLGTPVIAAAGGRVMSVKVEGELGKTVRIDHGSGWQTIYAHLSATDVQDGHCIAPLAAVGKVGSTGMIDGPRLHFEVRKDGQPVDPLALPFKGDDPASDP